MKRRKEDWSDSDSDSDSNDKKVKGSEVTGGSDKDSDMEDSGMESSEDESEESEPEDFNPFGSGDDSDDGRFSTHVSKKEKVYIFWRSKISSLNQLLRALRARFMGPSHP